MAHGDHIYVDRLGYTHHSIDCGDGTVIHYTGWKSKPAIRRTSLQEFTKGVEIKTRSYGFCDSADTVVERAEKYLVGVSWPFSRNVLSNLAFNNCEHFATWCKTEDYQSEQVKDRVSVGGGAVGRGAVVAAGLGTIVAIGAVAVLSWTGVMSTLVARVFVTFQGTWARLGADVYDVYDVNEPRVFKWIVVACAAPAAITTVAMLFVLRHDPILHETERKGRAWGKLATIFGAAGSYFVVVVFLFLVSMYRLSDLAIFLDDIGAKVGGGILTAVSVTAGLPAVAAAALGYVVYRLCRL